MSVLPITTKRFRRKTPIMGLRWPTHWSWTHLLLLLATTSVAILLLLTPVYLLIRTAGAGQAALDLLLRPSTLATLGRTVWLASSVTVASIAIAVPLAWLTTCTDLPGRKLLTILSALPLVLPSYVFAYLIASLLGPRGLMQQALEPLTGLTRLPDIYGFPGAFLTLTLMSYPYIFLSVRAGLKRLDPVQLEAARSLGMSPLQAFRRITLPQLRPAIVAGSLLVSLYVLRDFGAVTMMRYDTFTRVIYLQYRSFADRAMAASLALVLVALTAVVLYFEWRSRSRAQYARRSVGAGRQTQLIALGRWRWVAVAGVMALVGLALLLPAGGLLYWFIRGLDTLTLTNLLPAASNSLLASLGAALLAVLAALPVAIMSVRRPSGWSQLLERLTYAGYALPGLVIALALVFFGLNVARPLYQTLPLLLIAYVVLFIPQAVGTARASLLQVPRSLEEAGRSLGYPSLHVLRRVTLPLLRPGLAAGATLVFLTCMKELPATLILSPAGFNTLSTAVWSNISEAFFAQAAAPALLLILLSSIPLAYLTFSRETH